MKVLLSGLLILGSFAASANFVSIKKKKEIACLYKLECKKFSDGEHNFSPNGYSPAEARDVSASMADYVYMTISYTKKNGRKVKYNEIKDFWFKAIRSSLRFADAYDHNDSRWANYLSAMAICREYKKDFELEYGLCNKK